MRHYRLLGGVLLLTGTAFTVGMIALSLLWKFLLQRGYDPDFWSMTGALATAVAAATFLGAAILAYRELDEATTSRQLDIAELLYQEMNSPQSIEARRWIYDNLTGDPVTDIASLDEHGREQLKRVLNSLDHLALVTRRGAMLDEMTLPWLGPMVIKAWAKLQPYVTYERKRRNEPEFYQMIDELVARCIADRRKRGLDAQPTWVENAL